MNQNSRRHLAAVMFADMEGFTALMQLDEAKAKNARDRQRKVLSDAVEKHGGKIVQYYGDGSLVVFDSAIEGVTCAVEIQQELQKEPKVALRIGIHSGDVAYDDDGIYGDCVNVASRIESLSVSGAVLISDKVFDEIKNHQSFRTHSLGLFNFKNVERKIEVFALENEGLVVPHINFIAPKANVGIKSIAVLPFINMSTDPDNEYFSDGISEEILIALSKVPDLQVTARTSSFSFKGKNEDVREIGKKLNVATVLEGSVRKARNKVRITAQLIDTSNGYHYWSETYDRDLEDIFEVQDEISKKIVTRLTRDFAASQQLVKKVPTENLEAYNLYLKGKYHWNKWTPEDIRKAINYFNEAIELDPQFSLPYCALSYCYSFLGSAGQMQPSEAYSKAQDYSLKALALNPNHAESHLALATIRFYSKWDFDGAEESLNKALSLSLNSSLINQVHGWFLIARGHFNEAIDKMERAVALDPLSLPLLSNLADAYAFAERYDDALTTYDKIIEMDPSFRRGFEGKGMIYIAIKDYENAIVNLEKYKALVGNDLKGNSALGHAYAAGGYPEKAYACIEKIRQREASEPGVVLDIDYAFIYAGLKDFDKAFEYLDKAHAQRTGIACLGMIFCIRYPAVNDLKADPRFDQLVERIGL